MPETNAVRATLWLAIAVFIVLSAQAPAAPGGLALVRAGTGCRVGAESSAAACRCDQLPADARAALGLPQALNAASAVELERVPGLGPKRARAIAAERDRGGAFESLQALARRVPGIGPKTIDRIRPHLFAVGPDPACGEGSQSLVGSILPQRPARRVAGSSDRSAPDWSKARAVGFVPASSPWRRVEGALGSNRGGELQGEESR